MIWSTLYSYFCSKTIFSLHFCHFGAITKFCVIAVLGNYCNDERKGEIDASVQKVYADSITDFTQDFIAVALGVLDFKNFVFSPHSMYSVLAMLTSGATDNSTTQGELLTAFGRFALIESLEQFHGQVVKSYKGIEVEKTITFGNRLWTTPRYFSKIEEGYKCKIRYSFGSEFTKLIARNPENEVNDWLKEVTEGKTDKVIGKFSYLISRNIEEGVSTTCLIRTSIFIYF